jgi:DNA-binding response OmpR family regulator
MAAQTIILLEDDRKLASELMSFLKHEGFACLHVADGAEISRLDLSSCSLFLLDINVPSLNGIEVCRKIRSVNPSSPILMITAYSSVSRKVEAFDTGADDYLVKPFHLQELLARIKAMLRRTELSLKAPAEPDFQVADLVINRRQSSVTRGSKTILLTPKEYKLLELLADAGGSIVSKQTIAERVWDINFETGTNTIEVYINFLRNKVDKEYPVKLIHTRPGFGYYLKESPDEP